MTDTNIQYVIMNRIMIQWLMEERKQYVDIVRINHLTTTRCMYERIRETYAIASRTTSSS